MAVHTWWPRTSAWVPAQNDVVFTPWVPDVLLCTCLLHFALPNATVKCEFSTEYKVVDCPRTNINTRTRYPLKFASARSQPCTHWCLNSSMGTLEKSAFTLVHSEYCTQASCPGTKCECCFSVWVPKEGLQCGLCAGGTLKRQYHFNFRPVLAAFLRPRHSW